MLLLWWYMAKRLFVGGLAYGVTDDQLRDLFAAVGTVVSAQVIMDKFTGRSKGFGFVEMESDDLADKAIEQLHDKDYEGRNISVSEAQPLGSRDSRPPRSQQSGGRDRNSSPRESSGGGRRY